MESLKCILGVGLLVLSLSACGGGEMGEGGQEPSPSVSKDFGGLNVSTDRSFDVLSKALGGGSGEAKVTVEGEPTDGELQPVSGSVSCDPTGTVAYSGTVSEDSAGWGTFDLNLDFQSCEGISGNLSLAGSIFGTGGVVDKEVRFDGELSGEGCLLEFSALHLTAHEEPGEAVESGDGSFSVVCGEDLFACSFDRTDLLDQSALNAACTCSGAGCDAVFEVTLGNHESESDDSDEADEDDNGDVETLD